VVNLAFVSPKPTGLATYAINLIPHLPLSEMTVLASNQLTWIPAGLKTYPVPANLTYEQGKWGHLRRLLWTQWRLPQICAELQADLLFAPVPELPIDWTGNGQSPPAVVMVHDVIPLRFPSRTSPLTYYFRYYVPSVLRQARHILCNSIATAQDIQQFYGIAAAQITPIALGYDANHFRPVPTSASDRPYGSERPYFIYVGRHDPYKNLQRLIAAFAALPESVDCELWIGGSTDPRFTPLLQTQVNELAVGDRVKFLDYVAYADLPELLRGALAMVYPSLWEGFGFPVLEAMACGAPVITSHLSSLPEVVGDAAILIDPYNLADLTAAMQQIATDAITRTQLQQAGLARSKQFSWQKTGQATAALLQQFRSQEI
jgi:glycosyltransferase involved in cell wall biosynthesis